MMFVDVVAGVAAAVAANCDGDGGAHTESVTVKRISQVN